MTTKKEQYECNFSSNQYNNPILFGDFADPSILRDGDDYYLVNSVCGEKRRLMPMWHSKDLVNWEFLYHVFEGVSLEGRPLYTAWAPELTKHNGIYYIYNYSPDFGTWVTTCDDINKGNWSAPISIKGVEGIDPGHVCDEEGKRYLCMSTNVMYPLAEDGLSVTGEGVRICENWPIPDEYDIEGMCTESPKFFKRNGYVYFLTAQGGTMGPPTSHCVVAYRAKHPMGPYEISPYNPIVHTKSKSHGWWSTGHGSLVDTPQGDTYIIYHGIRNAHRYLGRQALMMPVTWTEDGWFTVKDDDDMVQEISLQIEKNIREEKISISPKDGKLGLFYNFDPEFNEKRLTFTDDCVYYDGESTVPWNSPAFAFMPQGYRYEYEVELRNVSDRSGFAIGYRFLDLANCGVAVSDGYIKLFKHSKYEWENDKITISSDTVFLKMRCDHGTVSYWVKQGNSDYVKFAHSYDTADWNPNMASGFSYVNPCIWSFGPEKAEITRCTYTNMD